jgi:hypothetical protein
MAATDIVKQWSPVGDTPPPWNERQAGDLARMPQEQRAAHSGPVATAPATTESRTGIPRIVTPFSASGPPRRRPNGATQRTSRRPAREFADTP